MEETGRESCDEEVHFDSVFVLCQSSKICEINAALHITMEFPTPQDHF